MSADRIRDERLQQAIASMHAADDMCDRVMEHAEMRKRRRRGGPLPLAAVLVAVVVGVFAMGGAAYALVSNAAFFQRVWSDHGLGDKASWTMPTADGDPYEYDMQYGAVDPSRISEGLDAVVEPVGLTVEGNGYTLSIESMAVDANACGAVTFILTCPDGLRLSSEYGLPGELVFDPTGDSGSLDAVGMGCSNGAAMSCQWIYDQDSATDTEVRGVCYFTCLGSLDDVLGGVFWRLDWHTGSGENTVNDGVSTSAFTPTQVVGARSFTDGEGNEAQVSPFSLLVKPIRSTDALLDNISLRFIDDGTYVVEEEHRDKNGDYRGSSMGYYTSSLRDGTNEALFTFTQYVNPEEVASVVINGRVADEDFFSAELTPTS